RPPDRAAHPHPACGRRGKGFLRPTPRAQEGVAWGQTPPGPPVSRHSVGRLVWCSSCLLAVITTVVVIVNGSNASRSCSLRRLWRIPASHLPLFQLSFSDLA